METQATNHSQDVYADAAAESPPPEAIAAAGITLMLERTPAALARVYALLCTVDLVPSSSCGANCGDDALRLDFAFDAVPQLRFDMLVRKLAQLTECLEVTSQLERRRAAAYAPPGNRDPQYRDLRFAACLTFHEKT